MKINLKNRSNSTFGKTFHMGGVLFAILFTFFNTLVVKGQQENVGYSFEVVYQQQLTYKQINENDNSNQTTFGEWVWTDDISYKDRVKVVSFYFSSLKDSIGSMVFTGEVDVYFFAGVFISRSWLGYKKGEDKFNDRRVWLAYQLSNERCIKDEGLIGSRNVYPMVLNEDGCLSLDGESRLRIDLRPTTNNTVDEFKLGYNSKGETNYNSIDNKVEKNKKDERYYLLTIAPYDSKTFKEMPPVRLYLKPML